MIKALLLIFDPMATWEGILRDRRSVGRILLLYLLPLLLIVGACDAYGLVHWGKWQSEFGRLKKFSPSEAVVVETIQLLLSVFIVLLGAKLMKSIGETFHGRHTYTQAFTAVAYSMSPLFLLRVLDVFAGISPWVSWAIGIILSVAVLYHGVPRMMEPDPSHAFGLYLMSALLLVLVTGLIRFVTGSFLQGKFPVLQNLLTDVAARLPL
jgi:hypothetical protein